MMRLLLFALFLLVLPGLARTAPPPGDIKQKQSQLEKLRKDIDAFESRIKEREKKEHATLDLLDAYDRQAMLLRKLIAKLHDDETSLRRDIDGTVKSIGEANDRLASLRKHYAHYVSTVYRYGRTYDLELLLGARSFNQALIRAEYLKRFSDQRAKDLQSIDARRQTLEAQNTLLQRQLAEEHALIADKQTEERRLALKMKKRKTVLADIRRDKKNYQKELGRKVQAVKDLQQLMAKLIEEDRVKKERQLKAGNVPPPERVPSGPTAFENNRGRIRWPVASGRVAARFGTQEHPTLHTITQNTGIDIAVAAGTSVVAVAQGEVSKIYWLPSFGNLVILNHSGGFRTVYAHLSEISVAEGDNVREGVQIGKSGESLSGPLLHFEIYRDREKQDPETWLRPRGLTQK